MMIQLSTGSFKYKFSASRMGLLLESCHYMSLSLRSLLDWGVRFTPLVSLSHIGFCQGENYSPRSPQPPKVEIQSLFLVVNVKDQIVFAMMYQDVYMYCVYIYICL